MRKEKGGYDWTTLPPRAIDDALRAARGGIVRVELPGLRWVWEAEAAWVKDLVKARRKLALQARDAQDR